MGEGGPSTSGRLPGLAWRLRQDRQLEAVRQRTALRHEMNVRVLNCATIRPYIPPIEVATCCLLAESDDGLILIDTGLGTKDHLEPAKVIRVLKRLSRAFGSLEETAVTQLAGLGHSPAEVRHIVMTHLHVDHAGGLPDFPDAVVHVFAAELETAMSAGALRGLVYISDHWAHGPKWLVHDGASTTDWFGFRVLPVLENSSIKVFLVPLPGHTRGHCGVLVGDGNQWLLHCGDAIAMDALRTRPGSIPARLLGLNFRRLHELAYHVKEVQLIPAHVRADKLPVLSTAG